MAAILLVDDDQFLRDINLDTLQSEGHTVTVAVDGEDAYQKIKSDPYDLILIDVILPKMTGIQVIQKLQTEKFPFRSKVLFLTNSDVMQDKQDVTALGASFYLKSELMPPDLIAIVNRELRENPL